MTTITTTQTAAGAAPAARPELETERLRLRRPAAADLADLAPILAKPEVMRYLGTDGEPISRAETGGALASMCDHWRRHGFGRWIVTHKPDQRLIGYGGLRYFGADAELVYLLDSPYWGRGLATELARACLRFGFGERGFARVVALTRPANVASRRVLEKLGMRCHGPDEFFRLMAREGLGADLDPARRIEIVSYSLTAAEHELRDTPGGQTLS